VPGIVIRKIKRADIPDAKKADVDDERPADANKRGA